MRFLIIVLTLALAACVASCHSLSLYYEIDFPPSDTMQLDSAREAWNTVTKPGYLMLEGQGWTDWQIERIAPADGFNGYTEESQHLVQISPKPVGASVFFVAVHEFGHVLGLKHTCVASDLPGEKAAPFAPPCTTVSRGVMDPTHVTGPPFTVSDLAECRRVGACY